LTILDAPIQVTNPHNVYLYENSHIGPHSIILASKARFILKKQSGSAGHLVVVTGNHARIEGRYYRSIKEIEKPDNMDKDVIVNEDVWMGLNVTLLSGVEIGRGATIASGAVVTKSIPPYCIAGGVPAKFIKFYWTIDEILKHEEKLYPENERYSKTALEQFFKQYSK
jgi:acetyltransferase-like isoleucine patch superfamily enzyme